MSKVIVITGGNSGIGQETANMFKSLGDTVVVIARSVETNEQDNVYKCDVTSEQDVISVFNIIGSKFGRIDVLVNNAGFGISGAMELIPYETINNLFKVNVMGVINCTKEALPFMNKGGKIINISSAMAFFPLPFRTLYASSKSAVITLSQGLGMELKNFGISVTAVCPGDVKTNFTKNRIKNFDTNEKYGNRIENAASELDQKENKRMSPKLVAKEIVKQANKKKSKHMVIIGIKYKVLYAFHKFMPIKWQLYLTEKFFGGYEK